MQELGIHLWQWLVQGTIHACFGKSQGIAIGQNQPLRLRLEFRDPSLVVLPWEIMQPQRGQQALALNQRVLVSRTTSNVDSLITPPLSETLQVLLVLGQASEGNSSPLQLQREAEILKHHLLTAQQDSTNSGWHSATVPRSVDVLIQPSRAQLVQALEQGQYNLFFYGGHGVTAADGGRLLLQEGDSLSGTELAQVLVRCQVTLAVFNACWGAQLAWNKNPDQEQPEIIPRSSLVETLIHHGVPAVIGMRDVIADEEALSFIQSLAQALSNRSPVDEAVAIARQQLLTLYQFNHPAWTLPVLYMHPEFEGQLIQPLMELPTQIPIAEDPNPFPAAEVRSLKNPNKAWPIRQGLMRVGRRSENDLVLREQWVSQRHAEIICRSQNTQEAPSYFLRDFSRFGTLLYQEGAWQRVHHQVVPLPSGTQMRFGSPEGQTLEFVIES
jgi:hypothetical protein